MYHLRFHSGVEGLTENHLTKAFISHTLIVFGGLISLTLSSFIYLPGPKLSLASLAFIIIGRYLVIGLCGKPWI